MLGVNFAGGNRAAVSDTERFSLPATGQRGRAENFYKPKSFNTRKRGLTGPLQ
jgi:hypothetical protein